MDETRAALKMFGVAVTDSEAEVEQLEAKAAQLEKQSDAQEVAALLKDTSDLIRELNTRWIDVTQRVFAIQDRLATTTAAAAEKML